MEKQNIIEKYFKAGNESRELGEYEKAIFYYEKVIEIDNENGDAYYDRGIANVDLGRYEEAIADFDKAIELNEKDGWSYCNRGAVKAKLGRYEEAIADFDKAIELNEKDGASYCNRGRAKARLGRYEEAIVDYSKAIEIDRENKCAYCERAEIKAKLGRYEEVIADYDEAIKINKECIENKDFYRQRGNAKAHLNRYEEAIVDYSKAIKIDRENKCAYCQRGAAKNKLGRYEEAIADYDRTIEIDKECEDIYRIYKQIADVKINLGKYEEVIMDCNKEIEIGKENKCIYCQRGTAKEELGRYQEAIRDYSKAIEMDKEDKTIYFYRGNVETILGRNKKAMEDFNRAIELDENFNEAYFARGMLKIALKNYIEGKKDLKKYLYLDCDIKEKKDEKQVNKIHITSEIVNILKEIITYQLDKEQKEKLLDLILLCLELLDLLRIQTQDQKFVHYTKSEVLKIILRKDKEQVKKLKLNNAVYMNDPEEGKIFRDMLIEKSGGKLSSIFQKDVHMKDYTYLACFCSEKNKDTLPMWVNYGNDGRGVVLVLNDKFFDNQVLYKVQYIDKNKDDYGIKKKILEKINDIVTLSSDDIFIKSNNILFLQFVNVIINYISYFFKDSAYAYEEEIRLVQFKDYNNEDIKIDEDQEVPKLYVEHTIAMSEENCEEVIVGPKANFEEIATYMRYIGIKKVKKSNIRYR